MAGTPQARIVGVGHASIDHVFEVDALPGSARKVPARDYRRLVGGMTANAIVACARLGARAALASPVGDDGLAEFLRIRLQAEGVDASGLCVVPGAHSSVSAVIVDANGQRLIVGRRGDAVTQPPPLDERVLDGADLLLTDPRCLPWCSAALRAARCRGVPSVLDADVAPAADLRAVVGLASWAVFSEPGLEAFGQPGQAAGDALQAALAAGAQHAVVTLGERGLLWQPAGGEPCRLEAFPVAKVVDTTAAGDVFHGALGVALAGGRSPRQALRFAAAAAALKCTRAGGVLGAPSLPEVEALLAARG